MKISTIIEKIWSSPAVYTLHSAGVDGPKKRAIAAAAGRPVRTVLDLGCGTGNSVELFSQSRYTGIDINRAYIVAARRRFPGREFIAADAAAAAWGGPYELILINSFLHHLPDREAALILEKTAAGLVPSGRAIIQEPLIPSRSEYYHRLLMRLDRGDHFRNRAGWLSLIRGAGLVPRTEGHYSLRILGFRGYHMISISARPEGNPV